MFLNVTFIVKGTGKPQGLIDARGREQMTTVINESGLYSLILSSKLPQAR